jgi:ABC-type sugar transport system ATPase subunit
MTLSDNIAVMSRGRLEQFGSPFEIYHQPATEFVASFVGKPRMNFFTAVHQERGRYAYQERHSLCMLAISCWTSCASGSAQKSATCAHRKRVKPSMRLLER